MSGIYGPIIVSDQVEAAVQAHLQAWIVAYLAEIERRRGLAPRSLPQPRTWKLTNEPLDRWPEDQVPAIIVTSPGLAAEPVVEGDGVWTCVFGMVVGVIVNDRDQASASTLAKIYGACLTLILAHHPRIADDMAVLRILDLGHGDLPSNYLKVGAAAQVSFEVSVDGMLQEGAGPNVPPDDPYQDAGDWPIVENTDLTLTPEAIT